MKEYYANDYAGTLHNDLIGTTYTTEDEATLESSLQDDETIESYYSISENGARGDEWTRD